MVSSRRGQNMAHGPDSLMLVSVKRVFTGAQPCLFVYTLSMATFMLQNWTVKTERVCMVLWSFTEESSWSLFKAVILTQTFWSQDPFILLKLEDPKELLFIWVFKKYLFIYAFIDLAVLDFSCSRQDLWSSLQRVGSLVAYCKLLVVALGSPDGDWTQAPGLRAQSLCHWDHQGSPYMGFIDQYVWY